MKLFDGLKTGTFKDLIQASGILFLASAIANLCSLLFTLYMVRNLTAVEYGVLNTLFSLLMILSMPAGTLQLVVTKFVSNFAGNRDFALIKSFIIHFGKRILLLGVIFLAIFMVVAPAIADFLKIASLALIIIIGFMLFFSFVAPLMMGILQGMQKFLALSINSIVSSIIKLILGITLVAYGFKVMGALLGIGLTLLLSLILAYFQLPRELFRIKECKAGELSMDSVYKYSVPVFFSLLAWMVLTNGDVILVKHYFSPEDAGFYSVAQMAGKIILFLPLVVTIVLFPKMNEDFSQQKSALPLLKKGLALIAVICVGVGIFCSLFPGFVLKVLTRKEHIESVRLVPFFCSAMIFYALVNQFISYNLAVHRFRFTAYLLGAALLQLGLISLWHPSLLTVLFSLNICSILLFSAGCLEAIRK